MEADITSRKEAVSRLTSIPWRMYLLIAVLGLITICLAAIGFYRGTLMAQRRAPRIDAIVEFKFEVALAQLHLENAMRRNQITEADTAWPHLDQAGWYAKTLLEGGKNPQGMLKPVRNPEIRAEIVRLQQNLKTLRNVSEDMLAADKISRESGQLGRHYQDAFSNVIKQADYLEQKTKNILADDLRSFYWIQWVLIALCMGLWAIIALAFYRFERRRAAALAASDKANELLAAEIAERKMSTLLGNLPGMAYRCLDDDQWTMIYLSEGCKELTGYDSQALLNNKELTFSSLVHPDDLYAMHEEVRKATKKNRQFTITYRLRTCSGEEKWLWEKGVCVGRTEGGVRVLEGFITDITGFRHAEEALRESELKFRTLFDDAADAIFLHDWQGNFLDVNSRACESLGFTRKELLKKNVVDIDKNAVVRTEDKDFWEGKKKGTNLLIESTNIRKDGSEFPVEIRLGAVNLPQGRIIMAVARDISERRKAESERETLIAKLEAQNAELERFTYTVSHDLKSPLITIKGFAGMLREDIAQGKADLVEHDISKITGAADKMGLLLEDLLELSRVGRLINPSQNIPFLDLAKEAVELNEGRISAIGAKIEIGPDLPVIHGDRIRLLEVMQNLVDNALKYMGGQKNPLIKIGVRREDGRTVCYVSDNGIGIEQNYHEKVFDLFEQLDPKADGTGIGLALIKRIIEVHGGSIWVESKGRGKGSTFCFTLPNGLSSDDAT